jgi:hypothetical protein
MPRILAACALVLVAACGERIGDPVDAFPDSGIPRPDTAACSHLAALYLSAFPAATACTPGVSQCTAQRPLPVIPSGSAAPTALCWTAYVGYLDPSRTADLDALLAQYGSAGCTLGVCPGPSPHETTCGQNAQGEWTCGRY